jgi:hypothetical protein
MMSKEDRVSQPDPPGIDQVDAVSSERLRPPTSRRRAAPSGQRITTLEQNRRSAPAAPPAHDDPGDEARRECERQTEAERPRGRPGPGREDDREREAACGRQEHDPGAGERIAGLGIGSTDDAPASVPSTRQEVNRSSFWRTMDSAATRISRTRGSTS